MSAKCAGTKGELLRDLHDCLYMEKITFENLQDCSGGSFSLDIMASYLKKQKDKAEGFLFYEKNSRQAVGYAWVMHKGGNEIQYRIKKADAFLFDVCVLPQCQGKGYSTKILAMITEYLHRERQIDTLTLACRTDNEIALKAYKKFGFTICCKKTFIRLLKINIPYYKL